MLAEEFSEVAFMRRVEVQNERERHPTVSRHRLKKLC
jgi:hypothetical protein